MEKYISEIAFIAYVERAACRVCVVHVWSNARELCKVAKGRSPVATHFRHFCLEIPRVADVRRLYVRLFHGG
jgi:hypothetical protein